MLQPQPIYYRIIKGVSEWVKCKASKFTAKEFTERK